MFRMTAPTRIAFGLASLCLGLLCAANSMGLMPDLRAAQAEARKSLCEAVALQACLAAQREDLTALRTFSKSIVDRNPNVVYAVVRRDNGKVIAEFSNLQLGGQAPAPSESDNRVEMPIFKGKARWGVVEIGFRPLPTAGLVSWLPESVQLIIIVPLVTFMVARFYLRRILQHLDPSSVIPERVRATLDTLAEGVLVLDRQQRIVLANHAFAKKVGRGAAELQGKQATDFGWSLREGQDRDDTLPWEKAIGEGATDTGVLMGLDSPDQKRTFVVNATPILGADGRGRGALATFDDVTSIEEKNQQLEHMLDELSKSRDDVRRQNRELQFLASVDPLTGCLNRRAFFTEFEQLWQDATNNRRPLSAIMVDIDHFKSINDTQGHAVGDRVLQMVAKVLRTTIAESDFVGRYGGEEFCVLLPDTTLAEAALQAEKLRTRIQSVTYSDRQVTASLGVSSNELPLNEAQELLDNADKAMYYSKHAGRNRMTLYTDVPAGWQVDDDIDIQRRGRPNVDLPIPYHAVTALTAALAFRDPLTAEHSRRVADLCVMLGQTVLDDKQCYLLEVAALLHDVGKLGVPDAILLKPGPLTADEWKLINAHDRIGIEILHCAFSSPELTSIVANHHSWYEGCLDETDFATRDDLPLAARILTIADAYDAMVSDRVYRKGRSCDEACAELRRCAGRQFDPGLVEKFIVLVKLRPGKAALPAQKQSALRLGIQMERMAAALDSHDYECLATMAHGLAQVAEAEGSDRIAAIAAQLRDAAKDGPEMLQLVSLTNELLGLCRAAQTTALAEAGEA
jgi:diguanylate cyclase (GGDEF)-like protein/PAS domain S-box-containing protein